MASYPSSAPTDLVLYVAVDNFGTTLNGAINASQTTITLTSVVGLPTSGILTIDSEKVHYTGISVNDITGCTRGFSATTASAHSNGATVLHNVVEEHHNALKDEIIAVASDLFNSISADLNDSASVTATAASVEVRLDQIATQIKEMNTGVGWKDAITKRLVDLVALDGTRTLTGNLPTGGFKLTGLGAGTTNGDSLRYEQVVGVYALDSAVVHLAGTETITGIKTHSNDTIFTDSVLVNTLTGRSVAGGTPQVQLEGTDGNSSEISVVRNSNSAGGAAALFLGHSRGTVLSSNTVLQSGDSMGSVIFVGADGSTLATGAAIAAVVDGTPGVGDMPGALLFYTTPDNTSTLTERMRISSGGFVGIGTQNPAAYNTNARHFVVSNSAGTVGFTLRSNSNASNTIVFTDAEGTTAQGLIQYDHNATAANETMRFRVGSVDDLLLIKSTGVALFGTATNDNATSGYIGEYVSSSASGVSAAPTNEYSDLTSISLTAGDWDVSLNGQWNSAGSTWTAARIGVSTSSGNTGTGLVNGDTNSVGQWVSSSATPLLINYEIPAVRFSLSATTTIYFKIRANYSAGTPTASGRISARRVR